MQNLFETTWTCDNCGGPNFLSDDYCKYCGAKKPSRYPSHPSRYKKIEYKKAIINGIK